ncbi:HNH endonuclease [Arthrobacter phage 1191A]|nr:HNH endonuclease [Arthrobacter phage 1191A]
MNNTCPNCFSHFTAWAGLSGPRKYCSEACQLEYNSKARLVPATCKPCAFCDEEFVGPSFKKYCSRVCYKKFNRAIERERDRAKAESKPRSKSRAKRKPMPKVSCTCVECGYQFEASRTSTVLCSNKCRYEQYARANGKRNCRSCGLPFISGRRICDSCLAENRKESRKSDRAKRDSADKNHRSRARKFGVEHESVNRMQVFDRDGWICGICDEAIFKSVKYPDMMSASLDHVIPMSRGGGHLYSNTQASHLSCNIAKGASLKECI